MKEKDYTVQEIKGMISAIIESLEFTEEQNMAIDRQVAMTQELYDSILDKCEEIGPEADSLFFRMLEEYPEFVMFRVEKIKSEVQIKE